MSPCYPAQVFSLNGSAVVNILLFPVKLGPLLGLVVCLSGASACGYAPAYGGRAPEAKLAVVAGDNRVAELGVGEAAIRGVRAELARAGGLARGERFPRVVVEVLRVDEATRGVTVAREQGQELPLGRGTAVAVTARAWVETAPDERQRDTGDIRRSVTVEAPLPEESRLGFRQAAEAAAEEVGRALARRILGEPVASSDPF